MKGKQKTVILISLVVSATGYCIWVATMRKYSGLPPLSTNLSAVIESPLVASHSPELNREHPESASDRNRENDRIGSVLNMSVGALRAWLDEGSPETRATMMSMARELAKSAVIERGDYSLWGKLLKADSTPQTQIVARFELFGSRGAGSLEADFQEQLKILEDFTRDRVSARNELFEQFGKLRGSEILNLSNPPEMNSKDFLAFSRGTVAMGTDIAFAALDLAPNQQARIEALESMSPTLLDESPSDFSNFVKDMKPGSDRDAAIRKMVEWLNGKGDVQSALLWSSYLNK